MSYRELPPPPALRPYVDRFWTRTPEAGTRAPGGADSELLPSLGPAPAVILPDGCIDVLIDVRSGRARVVGTMTHAVAGALAPSASIAAVRFKPGAARAFLRVPAAELTDRVVGADEVGCRWLSTAPVEGAADAAPLAALRGLERALLERLSSAALQLEVREAARRLFAAHPPSVDALARELGRSRQHLARQFREHVGVGPKELGRVARLQRAIAAVQHGTAPSRGGKVAPRTVGLAQLALDLGYFDQAHMSREFNELAGLTPRAARERRDSIYPIPSLWLEP